MKKLTYIVLGLILIACEPIQRYRLGEAVAMVGSHKLYEADLKPVLRNCHTAEDSLAAKENYIKAWATEMLIQEESEKIISNAALLEQMVADYRHSLYAYEWEKTTIEKRMRKLVADTLITQYYEQFPTQYVLRESIMKGLLLVVPQDAPKQDSVLYWLKHFTDQRLEQIEKYAYSYGSGYELFIDNWMAENRMLQRLPVSSDEWQKQLKASNALCFTDSAFAYYVYVQEKHFAGQRMPIEYARAEIEQTILQQRQVLFLKQERERLYREAIRKEKVILTKKQ